MQCSNAAWERPRLCLHESLPCSALRKLGVMGAGAATLQGGAYGVAGFVCTGRCNALCNAFEKAQPHLL